VFSLTIAMAVTAASSVSPAAEADNPPKEVKEIASMVGNWKGSGTLTMGADKANLRLTINCQAAVAGWGVHCHARFDGAPGGGPYLEEDLFGFDPGTRKYHWFSITSAGETHDHVSDGPKENTIEFIHNGVQEGKPLRETIRLNFQDNCTKFDLRSETTVGGQVVAVLEGHAHK
jgi:hypothetical protein